MTDNAAPGTASSARPWALARREEELKLREKKLAGRLNQFNNGNRTLLPAACAELDRLDVHWESESKPVQRISASQILKFFADAITADAITETPYLASEGQGHRPLFGVSLYHRAFEMPYDEIRTNGHEVVVPSTASFAGDNGLFEDWLPKIYMQIRGKIELQHLQEQMKDPIRARYGFALNVQSVMEKSTENLTNLMTLWERDYIPLLEDRLKLSRDRAQLEEEKRQLQQPQAGAFSGRLTTETPAAGTQPTL